MLQCENKIFRQCNCSNWDLPAQQILPKWHSNSPVDFLLFQYRRKFPKFHPKAIFVFHPHPKKPTTSPASRLVFQHARMEKKNNSSQNFVLPATPGTVRFGIQLKIWDYKTFLLSSRKALVLLVQTRTIHGCCRLELTLLSAVIFVSMWFCMSFAKFTNISELSAVNGAFENIYPPYRSQNFQNLNTK